MIAFIRRTWWPRVHHIPLLPALSKAVLLGELSDRLLKRGGFFIAVNRGFKPALRRAGVYAGILILSEQISDSTTDTDKWLCTPKKDDNSTDGTKPLYRISAPQTRD